MKETSLKIIAGVVALLFITGLLFVVNSFVGNPVSAAIATHKIKQYVRQTYPSRDFELSKATYNMKNSAYVSLVHSETSEDTRFSVYWRGGTIGDNYQSQVVNMWNTYVRLEQELDSIVEDVVEREFPYPVTLLIAGLNKPEQAPSSLRLDMSLDIHNPPLPAYLTVWIASAETSYQLLAEHLVELHNLMQEHNIPFENYSIRLEKPWDEKDKAEKGKDDLSVYDIPVEMISQENLAEVLKAHQENLERTDKR